MSTHRIGRFSHPAAQPEEFPPEAQWMDYDTLEEPGGTSIATDLAQNERAVHLDFFNDFDDIFNDENLD